ncbi:probable GTP-binding protein OBGM, mitochondrial [Cynara cardunculus var. scolymus]|uniref:probable GTP-binding protein OBGM, mitochondrial n=1 Tax=Cynara cardunculus var. scolymus TaxID=59895 RepID=UPI000D628F0F|nr:probable GTP-binding protein OBGM, mitochondrial [Cynara cardunculus var. scolymus]
MWLHCKNPVHCLEAFGKYSKSRWILQTSGLSDTPFKKPKLAPLQERRMIDRHRLWAKGGDGGNGCFSFHRSRHDRRGRPDGGNGGRGGDVILECSSTVWDLSSLQHHINAKRGGHGASKNKIGSRGDDKVVLVPIGTVLHLVEGDPPSVVRKGSSAALNPWEIGGTLEFNQHGTGLQPTSSKDATSNKNSESFTKDKKTSMSNSFPQLPQPSKKSNVDLEGFNFWEEKKMSSWEARVTGTGVSESEPEDEGLSGRPSLIVANKVDEVGAGEVYEELRRRVGGVKIFPVCAVLGEGVLELKDSLRMLVNGEDLNQLALDSIVVD